MNGVFLSVSLYVSASCSLPVLRAFFSALVYCAEIERVLRLVVFPVVTRYVKLGISRPGWVTLNSFSGTLATLA